MAQPAPANWNVLVLLRTVWRDLPSFQLFCFCSTGTSAEFGPKLANAYSYSAACRLRLLSTPNCQGVLGFRNDAICSDTVLAFDLE
jgi:hypothetical protein